MYYGMVKPLPIMLGNVPRESIWAMNPTYWARASPLHDMGLGSQQSPPPSPPKKIIPEIFGLFGCDCMIINRKLFHIMWGKK